MSSVTVPTRTIVFDERSGALWVSLIIREMETGGRFVLERKRRWRMTFGRCAELVFACTVGFD